MQRTQHQSNNGRCWHYGNQGKEEEDPLTDPETSLRIEAVFECLLRDRSQRLGAKWGNGMKTLALRQNPQRAAPQWEGTIKVPPTGLEGGKKACWHSGSEWVENIYLHQKSKSQVRASHGLRAWIDTLHMLQNCETENLANSQRLLQNKVQKCFF